jgi:CheY-like chemotaxis protein
MIRIEPPGRQATAVARVLIVDDDPEILKVLRLYLEQYGHRCLAAHNGSLALRIIREEQPDLVITDVMMPGLTGGALYQSIRQQFGPDLPVIISTGTSLKFKTDDDPLADFCPKQDDYEEMMGLVESLLTKRERLSS